MDRQPRTTDESLDDVLQLLAGDGHVSETDIRRAESWARDQAGEGETPWYLQPLIFFGALLAAGMFTVGIASMFGFRGERIEVMTMGAVYMVVALVLHFSRFNDFTGYLGLSFSIGAHVFLLVGMTNMNLTRHPEMAVFFTAAALCAALYGLYRDFLHRFLSCALVIVVANFAFPQAGLGEALHGRSRR